MTIFEATFILFLGSLIAGFLGSLSGLGGGLIIVPLLVMGLHVDIHYAIGASLLAVIATSTGSSIAFVKEGYSNVRIGIFLETATCIGSLGGVMIGMHLPVRIIFLIFGCVLLYSSISILLFNGATYQPLPPDKLGTWLKLNGTFPSQNGLINYRVRHVPFGYLVMLIAGALSGILGIGSGVLKVLALDKIMHVPFKVSTTTSNFMIGVTAAAGVGLYLHAGYIDPILSIPIILGITIGSVIGAWLLPYTRTDTLRYLFAILVIVIGMQSLYRAIVGDSA